MFSLIYARINDWVNNREAGDLRRHRGHYDVNVMRIYVPKEGGGTINMKSTVNLNGENSTEYLPVERKF